MWTRRQTLNAEPGRPPAAHQRCSREPPAENLAHGLAALQCGTKQATRRPSAAAPAAQVSAGRIVLYVYYAVLEQQGPRQLQLRVYPLACVVADL